LLLGLGAKLCSSWLGACREEAAVVAGFAAAGIAAVEEAAPVAVCASVVCAVVGALAVAGLEWDKASKFDVKLCCC